MLSPDLMYSCVRFSRKFKISLHFANEIGLLGEMCARPVWATANNLAEINR